LTLDSEGLKNYFEQFGPVNEANVVFHHQSMKSRGFAFVIFDTVAAVDEVLKIKDDHYIGGKFIECKPALLKDELCGIGKSVRDSAAPSLQSTSK
jgi:RNA recognition motif-containing protein